MARPKKTVNYEKELEELESKIEKYQKYLIQLRQQKKVLMESRQSATYENLMDAIKSSDKSPEEILTFLQP